MIKKILVIDDERETVAVIKRALTREGFDIFTAYDGSEAKEKILDSNPDMLILDIKMPYIDGWQVLQWVRQEQKLKTPTIVISADGEFNNIKKTYNLDADYYIIKPIDIDDLVKGIKTIELLTSQVTS